MTLKRTVRDRRLTPEEATKYTAIREKVVAELPDLLARNRERTEELLTPVLNALKRARDAKGLTLADMTDRTGMDRSALSKLETGMRPNPTFDTLARYAEAVGKKLVVTLADE